MGFLDTDEFIVVTNTSLRIHDRLRDFEEFGGLTLNWKMFGSSSHVNRPPGGVLGNYHKCYETRQVKSIVNTKYTLSTSGDPHTFIYTTNHTSVDIQKKISRGPLHPRKSSAIPHFLFDKMYINHYCTKSRQDFTVKIAKGRADYNSGGVHRTIEYFDKINSLAVNDCGLLHMPK